LIRLHQILWTAVLALSCAASFALPAAGQFETRSLTPVFNGPFSVAVGDFNRDGKQDVVVANRSGPVGIAVLLGNGDGTLLPPVNYSAGQFPIGVATADLNHDGILDLVVASDGLYVLLGNGDGTFQAAMRSGLNYDPNSLAIGDFNGDHIPDAVAAGSSNFVGTVSMLLGNGDGTFQAPIDITFPSDFVSAVAVGDFDRDGKPDVVGVERGVARGVFILLGNGDGTFRHGAVYDVPTNDFTSVSVADFRGIGRLDLAVGGAGPNGEIAVLLGNGNGTFQSPVFYPANFQYQVITADVNGDGNPDLVAAVQVNSQLILSDGVSLLLGNGDGTFQPVQNFLTAVDSRAVAVADMNGDKQLDLINTDLARNNVIVSLNTGVVSFSPITPINFPFQLVGTGSSAQTVTLTNTGATALTISSVTSQGPFSTTTTCKGSVAAGANCVLKVKFLPVAEGPAGGTVTIKDSASTRPQVIDLTGAGTVIDLSPLKLSFPPQKVGTTSSQTVTLTNQGSTSVNITAIFVRGTNPNNFAETQTCGATVGPGASCTITVTFKPIKTGFLNAYVEIIDDGGGSPQRVTLTGTGT